MIKSIETDAGSHPVTLAQLETACAQYDLESETLEARLAALDVAIATVKAEHLPGLKRQAGVVANREAFLISLVEAAPHLFVRPKTMIISGVKIGFAASQGKVEFTDDEANVMARIHEYLADIASTLIRTTHEVNKDAVRNLPDADLKTIGCTIQGRGDQVLVKRTAGDVEKLFKAMVDKLVKAMVNAQ